jgi:hypothetical protein
MDAQVLPDGNVMAVGVIDQIGESNQFFWCELDQNLNVLSSSFTGTSQSDRLSSIQLLPDGQLIMTGLTTGLGFPSLEVLLTLIVNSEAELVDATYLGFQTIDTQSLYGQNAVLSGSNIYLTGWTDAFSSEFAVAFHKLDNCGQNGCTDQNVFFPLNANLARVEGTNTMEDFSGFFNYPLSVETTTVVENTLCEEILVVNEFSPQSALSFRVAADEIVVSIPQDWQRDAVAVRVMDSVGRIVLSDQSEHGVSEFPISISEIARGLFFIEAYPVNQTSRALAGKFIR